MTYQNKAMEAAEEINDLWDSKGGGAAYISDSQVAAIIRKHMQPSVPVSELEAAWQDALNGAEGTSTAFIRSVHNLMEEASVPEPKEKP